MNILMELIRAEVQERGAISFQRFMEVALYYPDLGYYEQSRNVVGRKGDFYTSVSVGPLFGELLAFQFSQWTKHFERIQWVEAGAHDGQLALDILSWLEKTQPSFLERLEYWIIEPSWKRQAWQREKLSHFEKQARWSESWRSHADRSVSGVVFSNELLDAFPVVQLIWDAECKRWFQLGVGWNRDGFVWTKMDLDVAASEVIPDAPVELLDVLPNGFMTEASPAAEEWWRAAARTLRGGCLLAVDYGLVNEQFFVPERTHGTLRSYQRHRFENDLLASIGEQDLTAHVNFTRIQRVGEMEGLSTEIFESQTQFLTRIVEAATKPESGFGEWGQDRVKQLKTLVHPEHLGRPFKVFAQTVGFKP